MIILFAASLVTSHDLQVTEVALTGEPLPVDKDAAPLVLHVATLAECHNMAYASYLISYGTATDVVVATGDDSDFPIQKPNIFSTPI